MQGTITKDSNYFRGIIKGFSMSILKSADVCNAYWIYGAKNQIFKTHLHLVSNVVNITAAAFIFQNLWLSVACRGRGGGGGGGPGVYQISQWS